MNTIIIHFGQRNVRIGAAQNGIRKLIGNELYSITHTDLATHNIYRESRADDELIEPLKRYEVREGEAFYACPLKINKG